MMAASAAPVPSQAPTAPTAPSAPAPLVLEAAPRYVPQPDSRELPAVMTTSQQPAYVGGPIPSMQNPGSGQSQQQTSPVVDPRQVERQAFKTKFDADSEQLKEHTMQLQDHESSFRDAESPDTTPGARDLHQHILSVDRQQVENDQTAVNEDLRRML